MILYVVLLGKENESLSSRFESFETKSLLTVTSYYLMFFMNYYMHFVHLFQKNLKMSPIIRVYEFSISNNNNSKTRRETFFFFN